MTLDEIVAGIAHTKCQFQNEVYNHFGTNPQCPACQLIALRAELEEMMQRWNEEADRKYFTDARFALQKTAEELRAKIGEER